MLFVKDELNVILSPCGTLLGNELDPVQCFVAANLLPKFHDGNGYVTGSIFVCKQAVWR